MSSEERKMIKEEVFARDKGQCVFCDKPAVDAHHLLERRLWDDGGYHLDNLISVCYDHHMLCEQALIPVEDAREAAGITKIIVPSHLYDDVIYDKWGNPQNGRGELFWDESVQKVIDVDRYSQHVKYPRTYHLPWSNPSKDDRVMTSLIMFMNEQVVVTEKMDGENTTLYCDGLHARSLDSGNHPSRDWVKQFWAKRGYEIPYDMRVCGENLYATHSINYEKLPSYFLGFSVWDKDTCLSWDDTVEWLQLFDIKHVPVLYEGIFDEAYLRTLAKRIDTQKTEGYVVRVRKAFKLFEFRYRLGKYVRNHHVTENAHWSTHFTINTLEE